MAQNELPGIGWVGTGVMGAAMCGHLLAAGHPVRVFTRTKERARPLLEQGADWCPSPAEAAAGADFAVTMVGYPSDVREVVLGASGVLSGAKPGATVIDMTTSEPQLALDIFEAAREKGVGSLDAPVSGGDVGARDATLVIMVGGLREIFDKAFPVLRRLGKTVTLQGGPGAGQHTKMANQIAIASGMVAVCESLLYASRAGLDVAKVIETIGTGAAGSWSLANYAPRAVRGDFEPGFKIDHFIKDMAIALDEARRLGLALPGLALAEQLYISASSHGLGQKGTHALLLALAELSGTIPTLGLAGHEIVQPPAPK
jgi:3-hydroxyisobutyrate dehydrogenase